jgi:integrase
MINAIDEMTILKDAAEALQEHDRQRQALKTSEDTLRALCRRWGDAAGLWGVSPTHLRRACEARGLLNEGTNNEPAV